MHDIFPVNEYLKNALAFMRKQTRHYEQWMQQGATEFVELSNRFVRTIDLKSIPDKDGWACIRDLETFLESVNKQINATREQIDTVLGQLDITSWEEAHPYLPGQGEPDLHLPFPDAVFEPLHEAHLFRRLYYLFCQKKYAFRQFRSRKKTENEQFRQTGRIFNRNAFWTGFIQLPAFEHLSGDWNQTLHAYAYFVKKYQQETTEIITRFYHALEPFDTIVNRNEERNAAVKDIFQTYQKTVASLQDGMAEFRKNLQKGHTLFRKDTAENITRHIEVTGSFLYPAGHLSAKKLRRCRNRQEKKQSEFIAVWRDYLTGLYEEWQKDIELDILQLRIIGNYLKNIILLNNELSQNIKPVFTEVSTMISATLDRFSSLSSESDVTDLKKKILNENRNLLRDLRQELLPRLLERVSRLRIETTVDAFIAGITSATERIADEHIILIEDKEMKALPEFKTEVVPLKELVMEEFIPRIRQSGVAARQHAAEQVRVISRQITTLDQIVEYNLEEALNLLKKDDASQHEKAVDIAEDGLKRAMNYVSEIVRKTEQCVNDAGSQLSAATLNTLNGLDELSDSERILRLKLRLARAKLKEDFIGYRKNLWNYIKKVLPSVWKVISGMLNRITRIYSSARKLSGFEVAGGDKVDLKHFALSLTDQNRLLPYIYQRLFRIEPLEDPRFFTSRDAVMEDLIQMYKHFQKGESLMTAVVGEMGNGKTTLINLAQKTVFNGEAIIRIDFTDTMIQPAQLFDMFKSVFKIKKPATWPEMEQAVVDEEERQICVIENLHRIFLRTVDGFEGIEHVLRFMNATRSKVFWLVTCGLHGWNYLDRVIRISRYFDPVIQLGQLTAEELMDVILKRHQVSGVMLMYETSVKINKSRAYRKLTSEEQRQAYLQNRFFEQLSSVSRGNITAALLYWQKAIKHIDEEEMRIVHDLAIDSSFLFGLTSEELFTLAALAQHEKLSAGDHGKVFDRPLQESQQLLDSLYYRGYLYSRNGYYSIYPVLFGTVIKNLQSKQILQ